MISFRLSPDEYERFTKLCSDRGVRSVSRMARIALQKLVAEDIDSDPISFEVRNLRSQFDQLANELNRLTEIVEHGKTFRAGGSA
jgi:hypothetical protein